MTPLLALISRRIRDRGPITVADYMELALYHPRHGYYRRGDPFGRRGDFITAPEVSQMFGELIGLWCAVVWQSMGAPAAVVFCEMGPGRGTLMADALRAATRTAPAFVDAAQVHLVETSPALRALQRKALSHSLPARRCRWHDDIATVPEGPILVVANELFDALPIRQYVRHGEGWCERRVGRDASSQGLAFVGHPVSPPDLPPALAAAAPGQIVEVSPARCALAAAIGGRVAKCGGVALIIDYGHRTSAPGDTLQALRRHAVHDVLDRPGEADLTAHVDFEALAAAAGVSGARIFGPVEQGAFLQRLGIESRARALAMSATPAQRRDVAEALHRLVHPGEMGSLFKALAIAHADLPVPPGFANE